MHAVGSLTSQMYNRWKVIWNSIVAGGEVTCEASAAKGLELLSKLEARSSSVNYGQL